MSPQPDIPRLVALQQSSPPLHQPGAILKEKRKFEKGNPLNGKCANSGLSQQRGSPQDHESIRARTSSGTSSGDVFSTIASPPTPNSRRHCPGGIICEV